MPSIVIHKKVAERLIVEKCPCCGSEDVHARHYASGYHCDGMVYAWVICNNCGHEVKEERYCADENSLLRRVVNTWNAQTKSRDNMVNELETKVAELESELEKAKTVNNILKNVAFRMIGNPFGIGDLSDDVIIQKFGDTNLSCCPLGIDKQITI